MYHRKISEKCFGVLNNGRCWSIRADNPVPIHQSFAWKFFQHVSIKVEITAFPITNGFITLSSYTDICIAVLLFE